MSKLHVPILFSICPWQNANLTTERWSHKVVFVFFNLHTKIEINEWLYFCQTLKSKELLGIDTLSDTVAVQKYYSLYSRSMM